MRTSSWLQRQAERLMLDEPRADRLRHWSQLYSATPHLAGDREHAERICDLWQSYGISTKLVRYDVLQNFPESSSLSLLAVDGSPAFQASLTEDEAPGDSTSSPANGYPAFHGFSANGDVCAELVYANFGTLADFQVLQSRGISVKDKIVICKYSKVFRGLKVLAAQNFGAAGIVIYNDPQEDGEYTVRNGYAAYPDGPARHPKSIQRGSVDFFSVAVGDPTTPGYPSLPGDDTARVDPYHAIPKIPSLPISYSDAVPFLQALNGIGSSPDELGEGWRGQLEEVDYFTGPSTLKVSLSNEGIYKYSPIYNVIGTIPGIVEESIILGNHHDSWCCGAVDPVSGSAAMNEVARGLGILVSNGWRPHRKLILASWDNEEYGLVGSTEWGEEHAEELKKNCVAYINVDEATNGGSVLGAIGSPLLAQILRDITALVPSPVNDGKTVYDDWLSDSLLKDPTLSQPSVQKMGTGSDYTVFFDHFGIPSIDIVFNRQGKAVYPYHSNYDSYYWLDKFGDVGFKKHLAMARLWGALVVRLAGSELIPFKVVDYSAALKFHIEALSKITEGVLDLRGLNKAVDCFEVAAIKLDREACKAIARRREEPWDASTLTDVSSLNAKYMKIERMFLCPHSGLPGRIWYKHMIFAPGLWEGYDGVVFPGVVEALQKGDVKGASRWVDKISDAVRAVANVID